MADKKVLRLILGDQLNPLHSWFRAPCRHVVYTLMAVRPETDDVTHHIQKVAGFFAAMRRFGETLARQGHRVIYFRLDDPANEQDLEANLRNLIRQVEFRPEQPQPLRWRRAFAAGQGLS